MEWECYGCFGEVVVVFAFDFAEIVKPGPVAVVDTTLTATVFFEKKTTAMTK